MKKLEKKPYTAIIDIDMQGDAIRHVMAASPKQAEFFAKHEISVAADCNQPDKDTLHTVAIFEGHLENLKDE